MRSLPMSRSLIAWLLVVVGFAVMGAGWGGVQSTPVIAVQLAYLASGGFVGIGLVVIGVGLMYADDMRASREILEELRDRFDDLEHDVADLREEIGSRNQVRRGRPTRAS